MRSLDQPVICGESRLVGDARSSFAAQRFLCLACRWLSLCAARLPPYSPFPCSTTLLDGDRRAGPCPLPPSPPCTSTSCPAAASSAAPRSASPLPGHPTRFKGQPHPTSTLRFLPAPLDLRGLLFCRAACCGRSDGLSWRFVLMPMTGQIAATTSACAPS